MVDELVAPDYAYHTVPDDLPEGRDREWLKRIIHQLHDAIPDVTLTVEDMFAEGDSVVTRFVERGTLQSDLPWGPRGAVMRGEGRRVEFGGIIISRVANGQVVEEWEVMDFPRLWSQLGAL